jgi:hypothetical protein
MKTDNDGKILSTAQIVKRRELIRARWGFVLWMAVLCAVMLAHERVQADDGLTMYTSHGWQEEFAAMRPGMTYWPDQIKVERTDKEGPISDAELDAMLDRVMWSWGQRTGKTFIDAGVTESQGRATSGKITVVWRTTWEIIALTGNFWAKAATQTWTYTDTGHLAGAIIYLPSDGKPECLEHTALHEAGHAIGIMNHEGAGPHDVMHISQDNCRPLLSAQDVRMAPYADHTCHVELTAAGDLYIPSFRDHAALLKRDGDGWRLAQYVPTGPGCTTVVAIGMDVTFGDIRSQAGRFRGWLRYVGGERWVLGGAE